MMGTDMIRTKKGWKKPDEIRETPPKTKVLKIKNKDETEKNRNKSACFFLSKPKIKRYAKIKKGKIKASSEENNANKKNGRENFKRFKHGFAI